MNKIVSIVLLLVVAVYFGMAVKTQKTMQAQLKDDLKQKRLKAPEFNQRIEETSLFNILLKPSAVLKTD